MFHHAFLSALAAFGGTGGGERTTIPSFLLRWVFGSCLLEMTGFSDGFLLRELLLILPRGVGMLELS